MIADEVHGAIAGLVFAGHETTKNQLGWTIATLDEHPALWEAMAEGRTSVEAVVEEILRHRGVSGPDRLPVRFSARAANPAGASGGCAEG